MKVAPISKELDKLSSEVLDVLSKTAGSRNYAEAVPVLFSLYSLRVTPDNLRAWHVRRAAVEIAERTAPDVRCPIDEYAEAIAVWREARLTWSTISSMLARPAPDGFGFAVKQEALRSWWFRRTTHQARMTAKQLELTAGLERVRFGPATAPPKFQFAALEQTLDAGVAPGAAREANPSINGETAIQRKIREKNAAKPASTALQDTLLEELAQRNAPQQYGAGS